MSWFSDLLNPAARRAKEEANKALDAYKPKIKAAIDKAVKDATIKAEITPAVFRTLLHMALERVPNLPPYVVVLAGPLIDSLPLPSVNLTASLIDAKVSELKKRIDGMRL